MVLPRSTKEREAFAQVGGLGFRVDRAAETLPQGADGSLFTISGGRVLMLLILGEVTVAIANTANASLIKLNPTLGADQDLCAALDIDNDALGTIYTISGTVGDALRDDVRIGLGMGFQGMILSEGIVELECAGSIAGEIQWSMWWLPLDSGANVATS